MLVSIIISLLPHWLYNFVSPLYIFLSLLEAAYTSSPGPQVLYYGVIQFWSITPACSDGSENGNPLSTCLTKMPHLSAGEIGRLGATFQLLFFLPGLLTLVPISGHFSDTGNLGPFCLYQKYFKRDNNSHAHP